MPVSPAVSNSVLPTGRRPAIRFVRAALVLLALAAALPTPVRGEVAVIPVGYARAEDLLPMVKMLLTDTGKASFDRRTHSLVVVDVPDAVASVRDLLKKIDRPVPQLTLRVRFEENRRQTDQEVSAQGRIGGTWGSVGTPDGRGNRIDATVSQGRQSETAVNEQILRVASGSTAFIVVGKEIPYTRGWADVCRNHGGCGEITTFQRVETGFEVTPTVRGNRVWMEITPRLGAVDDATPGATRFVRAATEISATPGQWVDLGMVADEGNEVFSEILGRGRGQSSRSVDIRIQVETRP